MSPDYDQTWMRRCLDLAERGAGQVSPNPMVGAVLVSPDGAILGEGAHTVYGGPHAEREAVRDALERNGDTALGEATLYVNLEPCSHYGKTPPCTEVILEMGIRRVVVGMVDPFPEVAGSGIRRLRERGVEVTVGVLERECLRLNEAFVHHVRTGRPFVTLKVAQTLDGRVATTSGDARWVSGPESLIRVHRWRARLDGVLVGSATALADDPALTVRHVPGRQPVRFVLDRRGALPERLQVFSDGLALYTVAVTGPGAHPAYGERLLSKGGRVWEIDTVDGHLDLRRLLERMGREGGVGGRPLQSLLVEAGPALASALFRQNLVDRYALFIAPKLIGSGFATLELPPIERMADAVTFPERSWEALGDDMLFLGRRGSGDPSPDQAGAS